MTSTNSLGSGLGDGTKGTGRNEEGRVSDVGDGLSHLRNHHALVDFDAEYFTRCGLLIGHDVHRDGVELTGSQELLILGFRVGTVSSQDVLELKQDAVRVLRLGQHTIEITGTTGKAFKESRQGLLHLVVGFPSGIYGVTKVIKDLTES